MQLVIDTNILIAAFLKDAITRELLLDDRLNLIGPEHLLVEVKKHFHLLRKRIGFSDEENEAFFQMLTFGIEIKSQESFQEYLSEAVRLSSHKEDAPYLALALMMKVPIWSNDKGLKLQTKVPVFATHELLKILTENND